MSIHAVDMHAFGLPLSHPSILLCILFCLPKTITRFWMDNRPRGPMDKASAYGAGDCRFESCRGHFLMVQLRDDALATTPSFSSWS